MRIFLSALCAMLISCSSQLSADMEYSVDACSDHLRISNQVKNSGCDKVAENKKAFEALAYKVVKSHLNDPFSAKFEDVKVFKNSVYGEVYAKNSLGAYTGAKWFRLEYENGQMKFSMAR